MYLYIPIDFPIYKLSTGHVIILLILSFLIGQLLYSTGSMCEKSLNSGHEESHRTLFDRYITDGIEREEGLPSVFNDTFTEKYGIDLRQTNDMDVYRLTRSAIEMDNRGRSLHWDALLSFNRTIRFGSYVSVLLVLAAPVFSGLFSSMYTPVAALLEGKHVLSLVIVYVIISGVTRKAEQFYREGYVNYLIADYCNMSRQ
jgi:hypothetical protein